VKISEVRVLGDEELKKKLEEAHQELFNLRFRAATKKNIAQMMTILRERELGTGTTHGEKEKS